MYKQTLPLFSPSTNASNLASLAAAVGLEPSIPTTGDASYNPAVDLPSRLVRRIVDFEFIEMSDLLPDSWLQEENQLVITLDGQLLTSWHLPRRAPVQDMSLWIEYYSCMAAVLVSRFPDKGPELWTYQASIVWAARNFEGSTRVPYNRQYRWEALARKSLNWSQVNSRLYNEAFTGRAKVIPRCHHCLSDTQAASACLLNASPSTTSDAMNPHQPPGQEICRGI